MSPENLPITKARRPVRVAATAKDTVDEIVERCELKSRDDMTRCAIAVYDAALTRHLRGDTFIDRGLDDLEYELSLPVPPGRMASAKASDAAAHADELSHAKRAKQGETIEIYQTSEEVAWTEALLTKLKRQAGLTLASRVHFGAVIRAAWSFFDVVSYAVLEDEQREIIAADKIDVLDRCFLNRASLRALCAAASGKDAPLDYHPPGCPADNESVSEEFAPITAERPETDPQKLFDVLHDLNQRRETMTFAHEDWAQFEKEMFGKSASYLEEASKLGFNLPDHEQGQIELRFDGQRLLYVLSNLACLLPDLPDRPGQPVINLDRLGRFALLDTRYYRARYLAITDKDQLGLIRRSPLHALLTSLPNIPAAQR